MNITLALRREFLFQVRSLSSHQIKTRLKLFLDEKRRQISEESLSLNKVIVTVVKPNGEEKHLLMNDRISTYFDCTRHISSHTATNTAIVNVSVAGEKHFASVHEKIAGPCHLSLLNYTSAVDTDEVNKAYWRSCAFLLAAVIQDCFRSTVQLQSSMDLNYSCGRFAQQAQISEIEDWEPQKSECAILSRCAVGDYIEKRVPFEVLNIPVDLATEMFSDNPIRIRQIEEANEAEVKVCKLGDFVDICDHPPFIANAAQIGRFAVSEIIRRSPTLFEFSGTSLPSVLKCSSYSWDILIEGSRVSESDEQSREDVHRHRKAVEA
ncbi:hypothetical protein AB6A40_000200 [Gnathostoma spinigerum]|uniref:Uncharacterized protein n=1 Tax=Gnathostoma spinigerum TaxID=75299 RepID=A0ABD6E2V4_9BILA